MAESMLSLSSFKKEFDDQLTCGVCLDQYTNPKMLPCGHIFCLKCIQQLPAHKKYRIICPTCRVKHQTSQGGAINLPNAFHITSLLDLQKKLVTSETIQQTLHSSEATTCPKHNDLLTVYCETCCQVICRDCTISKEHNTHNFCLISECYPKHHQQIQDSLDIVKHKMGDLDIALANLATKEREVLQQGQQLKEQINTHAQQVIDRVQGSCTRLSRQVDIIVRQKTQILTAQRQQARKQHTQLKTCQDMIEHNLKEWTQSQILTKKSAMMDKINTATQHVDPTVFQPKETNDMQFTENETTEEEIGLITCTSNGKNTVKASPGLARQPSTTTLTTQSSDDSLLLSPISPTLTLSSLDDEHSAKCDITQTHPGKYNIKFTPSTKGKHNLSMQVGDIGISDHHPLAFPALPLPEMRSKPVNIITGLNKPWGVATCNNGDIVVTEWGAHCVTILNRNGKKVRSIGTRGTKAGQFTKPRGVAISDDGQILVIDKHRLQKLTTDGVCIKSIGSSYEGRGPLEFNYPTGIAVHPTTGQIFVADTDNYRIQVFTTNLTFSHTITHEMKRPNDIALDSEGYLYMADCDNHCITKLTTTGQYITRIAVLGSAMYFTIHNYLVYVSECGNSCVTILDTTGNFLHSFGKRGSGKEEFSRPIGIAIDSLGNLYVSDTENNRIVVY